MLVMMYLPFYLYTFVKSPIAKKKETFVQVLIAVILFLLLTVNVWLVLLYLRGTNHLLDPFINREIGKNGIDGTARYWLYTSISLMVLLILQFLYAVLNWKKFARWKKILHFIYFIFSVTKIRNKTFETILFTNWVEQWRNHYNNNKHKEI